MKYDEEFTKEDLKAYGIPDKTIEKIWSLPSNRYYKCVDDLQRTGWCVGCIYSIREWACKAIEWNDMDGNELIENWMFNANEVIPAIEEIWSLKIEPVSNKYDSKKFKRDSYNRVDTIKSKITQLKKDKKGLQSQIDEIDDEIFELKTELEEKEGYVSLEEREIEY